MREQAIKARNRYNQEKTQPSKESRPSNVFDGILYSNLPENEKSIDRLAQDAFLAITAGGDPAARTMAMAAYYLLITPQSVQLLQEELDRAMPDPSQLPELPELESLPVLVGIVLLQAHHICLDCFSI